MRPSTFSEGITTIEGKQYQKSYIVAPTDLFVRCPFCQHENDSEGNSNSHIVTCEYCGKDFYAEFDIWNVVTF